MRKGRVLLAALGLSRADMPARSLVMGLLISPMIVPLIISAVGMFFFYSRLGLQGTHLAVILAHAALGTPFVVITVTATLVGFDLTLLRAAASLGSTPTRAFFKVTLPIIFPGVMSGALFAFITSFDEVCRRVVCRVVSPTHDSVEDVFRNSRAYQSDDFGGGDMFDPCLNLLLVSLELLRRRGEKMRGIRH